MRRRRRRRQRRRRSVPLLPPGPEAVPAARERPTVATRPGGGAGGPVAAGGPAAVPAVRERPAVATRPGGGAGGPAARWRHGRRRRRRRQRRRRWWWRRRQQQQQQQRPHRSDPVTRHGVGDCGLVARHFPSKGLRPRCCGDIRTTLSTTPRTTPRTTPHDPLSSWHRRSPGARANYLPIPHPFWCSQAMPSIDPMGRRGT